MKKLITIIFFFIFILNFKNSILAQSVPKLQDSTNQFIVNKAFAIAPKSGIIYYKNNALFPGELFTDYINYTGLGEFDTMILTKSTHDSMLADVNSPAPNSFHDVYQQYYKNVKIEGALYTEHYNSNCVWLTSGFLVENLSLNCNPIINDTIAFDSAVYYVNSETYVWDSTGVLPVGELVIISAESNQTVNYKLTWKFKIHSLNPFNILDIYVDANNGEIVKELSSINHDGQFDHKYYGNKSDLDTKYKYIWWSIWDRWYLFADDNSRNIYTTNNYDQSNFALNHWYWDDMTYRLGSDNWGTTDDKATSAHYSVSKSWDFFKQTSLNRNGPTGWGKHLLVASNCNINGSYFDDFFEYGAAYSHKENEDFILVGNSSNGNHLSTYDMMGHEFTHAIIHNASFLPNEKISGAINESFSDIFGFLVERYMNNGVLRNWTIGEDASAIYRDIQNPNNWNHPSFYLQDGYYYLRPTDPNATNNKRPNRLNDFFGVHINAGVQNKWFYLLSMGGNQTISFNAPNSPPPQIRYVSGIGIDKASRIAYYAMTNFINYEPKENNTFEVVRESTIAAAKKLYGICSNEYVQTCKAWYAVNVGKDCEACSIEEGWCGNNENVLNQVKEFLQDLIKINLYPNPTDKRITIFIEEPNSFVKSDNYEFKIFDMNGKLVHTSNTSNINNNTINVENLSNGIYFVSITANNWVKNIKFVKK